MFLHKLFNLMGTDSNEDMFFYLLFIQMSITLSTTYTKLLIYRHLREIKFLL